MRDPQQERKKLFNDVAELYDSVRPLYPTEALDTLLSHTHYSRQGDILEIGPGTGQLTQQLLHRGASVTAVEPGPALATKLREKGPEERLTIHTQAFEDFHSKKRFPLAVAAQSFHWIDPERGLPLLASLLSPGGYFARIDNMKDVHEHPIRETLNALYEKHFPDRDFYHLNAPDDKMQNIERRTETLRTSTHFEEPKIFTFPWKEEYTSERYIALLQTYSDHLLLSDNKRALLLEEIKHAIDDHGGSIVIPYYTLLQCSRVL